MNLITLRLTGSVFWSISREDPAVTALRSMYGWSLINPLLYSMIDPSSTNHGNPHFTTDSMLVGEKTILSDSRLIFVVPDNFDSDAANMKTISDDVVDLMSRLRFFSQQVKIARVSGIAVMTQSELTELPTLVFPRARADSFGSIQRYIVDSAVTMQHLEGADTLPSALSVPVYQTLLLDAILALIDQDYRRALLYAAMSVETVAATKLDEAYEAALSEANDPTLRIVPLKQGKEMVNKDPVYEFLKSKTAFHLLLHERSLYVLGKSLKIEDEPLFQEANKLYRTRNKIAHRGGPPVGESNSSYFSIEDSSVRTAIDCAIHVFSWFGETKKYLVPRTGFVQAKAPDKSTETS